jgi:hypothetical protein
MSNRHAAVLLTLVLLGAGYGLRDQRTHAASPGDPLPASELPVARAHRYRMAGRVRPLLFWIGRDDVGFAKVVWRGAHGGVRGYEFLVGTDPAKAPRGINRWGYIADETDGGTGRVVAVMSRSDEGSLSDVEKSQSARSRGGDFRAMRSDVGPALTRWQTAPVMTAAALTIHDVPSLLEQVRTDVATGAARSRPTPAGARPGFLIAVAELVDRAVEANTSGVRAASLVGPAVPYVFALGSYELRFRSLERAGLQPGSGGTVPGLKGDFEILNLATRETTRFAMSFGTEGALAGVPVSISWQPRWWLQVELHLIS